MSQTGGIQVHYGHKEMDMISSNTQVVCGIWTMLNWF